MAKERSRPQLPSEIITLIILFVPQDGLHMRTLWSCCLLNHDWYNCAIGPLYARPRLTNKNFDKFYKTVCPPVNSLIRQIGLEALVRDLDMGTLAYESSNTMTARMLRRTRINLETFVAPAVSFSISCLAPLSKCTHLSRLDLSRDFYQVELSQLLNAIKDLPILHLSLPRSAMRRHCMLYPTHPNGSKWPKRLRSLEINDWLPQDIVYWTELFESWPKTLVAVAFEDCFNWNSFWQVYYGPLIAHDIKHVKVSLRRGAGVFPVSVLAKIFPDIKTLAIPTPITSMDPSVLEDDVLPDNTASSLEILSLREIPGLVNAKPFLATETILEMVESNPKMYKINVPEQYLQVEDDAADTNLEKMEKLMALRVDDGKDSGLYLT